MGRVVFEHVWKKFRRGERHDSLRDLVPALARGLLRRRSADELSEQEFWATRDVSFEVGPGEALGIIGPNGAGKSTILKLLTKILRPTRGQMSIDGRVGALIEVAAGFHPDLTGRENVYLQGAIMGMPRAEIARKFDAIVEFSGVDEFIDTPVKRYSSGMNARLGFAIAAHLDPDVLLIDEVLSVGDVGFQERCVTRMRELLGRGVPLVFVSHNLAAVVDLCTRAIFIERGAVKFDGRPAEAVAQFRQRGNAHDADAHASTAPIRINGVDLLQPDGESSALFRTDHAMTIRVRYRADVPVAQPLVAIDIHGIDGVYCAGINTRMDDCPLGTLDGDGHVDLVIPRLALLPGAYSISAGILDAQGLRPLDLQSHAYPFSVVSDRRDFGVVSLEHHWQHERGPVAAVPAGARPGRRRGATATAAAGDDRR
ncbi:MAG TPA: ABC transporter ATP-binding protein [Vicinamibacterales bacterium]|nr:ABC transporter ATP-binding protein [Vicinamibacterales bacterium]